MHLSTRLIPTFSRSEFHVGRSSSSPQLRRLQSVDSSATVSPAEVQLVGTYQGRFQDFWKGPGDQRVEIKKIALNKNLPLRVYSTHLNFVTCTPLLTLCTGICTVRTRTPDLLHDYGFAMRSNYYIKACKTSLQNNQAVFWNKGCIGREGFKGFVRPPLSLN